MASNMCPHIITTRPYNSYARYARKRKLLFELLKDRHAITNNLIAKHLGVNAETSRRIAMDFVHEGIFRKIDNGVYEIDRKKLFNSYGVEFIEVIVVPKE